MGSKFSGERAKEQHFHEIWLGSAPWTVFLLFGGSFGGPFWASKVAKAVKSALRKARQILSVAFANPPFQNGPKTVQYEHPRGPKIIVFAWEVVHFSLNASFRAQWTPRDVFGSLWGPFWVLWGPLLGAFSAHWRRSSAVSVPSGVQVASAPARVGQGWPGLARVEPKAPSVCYLNVKALD